MEACESGLRSRPDQFRDSAPAGCKPLLNRCFFVCHRPFNLPQEYGVAERSSELVSKLLYFLYEAFDNELACPLRLPTECQRVISFPRHPSGDRGWQSEIAQSVTNQVPKLLDDSLVPVYWGPTGRKSIGSNATRLKVLLDGNRRHVSAAISFLFCHISDGVSDA